jgi:hypothetical protein
VIFRLKAEATGGDLIRVFDESLAEVSRDHAVAASATDGTAS